MTCATDADKASVFFFFLGTVAHTTTGDTGANIREKRR